MAMRRMYRCPACGNLNKEFERGGRRQVPGVDVSCTFCGFFSGKYARFESEKHSPKQMIGVPGQRDGVLVFKDRNIVHSRRVTRMSYDMRVRFRLMYEMFSTNPQLAFNVEEIMRGLQREGYRGIHVREIIDYMCDMCILKCYMVNDVRYYKFSGKVLAEVEEFTPVDVEEDENGVVVLREHDSVYVWEREHGERVEKIVEASGEWSDRGVNRRPRLGRRG